MLKWLQIIFENDKCSEACFNSRNYNAMPANAIFFYMHVIFQCREMALKEVTGMFMQKKLSQLMLGVLLSVFIVLQFSMISDPSHQGAQPDRNQLIDHMFNQQKQISHGRFQMPRLVSNFTPTVQGGGNANINSDLPWETTFGLSLNLRNHFHLCNRRNTFSREPLVVAQVHSACDNKPQRDAIRNTWGNMIYLRRHVSVVFVVGKCRDEDDNRRIKHEVVLNRDILLLNITERYDYLTIKSLAGLLWLAKHCP